MQLPRPPLPIAILASCLLHALAFLLAAGGLSGTAGKSSPPPLQPLTLRLSDLSGQPSENAATVSELSPLAHSLSAPISPVNPLVRHQVAQNGGQEGTDPAGDAGSSSILPYYYPATDLDDPPRIVGEIDFDDSELAGHPEGGEVLLRLLIDERGTVERVLIDKASVTAELALAASARFASARVRPGSLNGRAVRSALQVEIRYAPASRESRPGRD